MTRHGPIVTPALDPAGVVASMRTRIDALGLDLVACGDRQRVMRQLIDHQQEVAVQIRRARQ